MPLRSIDSLYTVPTYMVSDNSVPVTDASEDRQQGHVPAWGCLRQCVAEETCRAPPRATDQDDSRGLDADEHGSYVELCFTTGMSKVALAEQQRHLLCRTRVPQCEFTWPLLLIELLSPRDATPVRRQKCKLTRGGYFKPFALSSRHGLAARPF